MRHLISSKKLMEKYGLNEDQLHKIMWGCISYFLSEEELYEIILQYYMKKELRINKKLQV